MECVDFAVSFDMSSVFDSQISFLVCSLTYFSTWASSLTSALFSASSSACLLKTNIARALDKREDLVIIRGHFCLSCIKTYAVTPHLNRHNETVQTRCHNIWFG